jgi:hypothetical protein
MVHRRPLKTVLSSLMRPIAAEPGTVPNPTCPNNTALFDLETGQEIGLGESVRGPRIFETASARGVAPPTSVGGKGVKAMLRKRSYILTAVFAFVFLALPTAPSAATVSNPLCPAEFVLFNPGHGEDIVVPDGFTVSVFASGLNAPTGIAFLGNSKKFTVYVLESGHGLPSKCNDQSAFGSGDFDPKNPFTPDILVFDQLGNQIGSPLGKPTGPNVGFQPEGPAIDIASNMACKEDGSSRQTPNKQPTRQVRIRIAHAS